MRGLNRVTIIGNVGNKPECKRLRDDMPVAKFSIATTETYRLKNGETQSRTDWHTIIAWRGLATLADQYVHKRTLLYVEGKLRNRQFLDKEGQKKFVTENTRPPERTIFLRAVFRVWHTVPGAFSKYCNLLKRKLYYEAGKHSQFAPQLCHPSHRKRHRCNDDTKAARPQ